jgi:hypothetical protein
MFSPSRQRLIPHAVEGRTLLPHDGQVTSTTVAWQDFPVRHSSTESPASRRGLSVLQTLCNGLNEALIDYSNDETYRADGTPSEWGSLARVETDPLSGFRVKKGVYHHSSQVSRRGVLREALLLTVIPGASVRTCLYLSLAETSSFCNLLSSLGRMPNALLNLYRRIKRKRICG